MLIINNYQVTIINNMLVYTYKMKTPLSYRPTCCHEKDFKKLEGLPSLKQQVDNFVHACRLNLVWLS